LGLARRQSEIEDDAEQFWSLSSSATDGGAMAGKVGLFIMIVLGFSVSQVAEADSACWPEEKLVGTKAFSFIENINTQLTQTDSGTCDVTVYAQPRVSSKGRLIPCKLMTCANGECGDGSEHTSLGVIDRSGAFAKVELKDGSTAWLNVAGKAPALEILHVASEGTLFPSATPVLASPNGASLKFNVKDGTLLAYTVVKIVKIPSRNKGQEKMAAEVWAEVDVFPIESAEPPIKLGTRVGHGFFLHRNSEGNVAAVLSAIDCD
jgi:hypothetical protein